MEEVDEHRKKIIEDVIVYILDPEIVGCDACGETSIHTHVYKSQAFKSSIDVKCCGGRICCPDREHER